MSLKFIASPFSTLQQFRGGMVKTPALYTKGRWFEPHRRRFFTPTVVLLSFKKPETVDYSRNSIIIIIIIVSVVKCQPQPNPNNPTILVKGVRLNSNQGPRECLNLLSKKTTKGKHKIGKMGRRCLWKTPIKKSYY